MQDTDPSNSKEVGIGVLPKGWAIVVQIVGTFGLAVFLLVRLHQVIVS